MRNRHSKIYDELLVIKSKQGEKQAFDELVARWQKPLWQFAFKITGSDADAWDMVQETWCEIIKKLTRLQDTAAFSCWVFRILNNKCIDLLRKKQRQSKGNKAFEEHEQKNLNEVGHCNEKMDFLKSAIEKLSADRQALLILRYFNNYNTGEIAEILGIPEGTVKSRLYRIMKKLRETMRYKQNGQFRKNNG